MKKHVLVTGGAGYIGSTIIPALLEAGHSVSVLDNCTFGGESLLGVWHRPHFQFIHGDITHEETCHNVFARERFDAVVHLAAIVGDPACVKDPVLARKVNYDASIQLLACARQHDVHRFLFASTCSNYGKMEDASQFVNETSALSPVSLYATLKVEFEKALLDPQQQQDGFCPTALRFATVYGGSPRMRFDLTVNEFVKELALGRPLEVFGAQFWRPYCHVSDFARAILLVLEAPEDVVEYQAFNVGDTGENYQKQMIVEEIQKVIPNTHVEYVKRDEDPRDYRVSFDKIHHTLGFTITKRVPDGIRETYDFIRFGMIQDPDHARYRNS